MQDRLNHLLVNHLFDFLTFSFARVVMLDLNEAQGGGKGEWEGYGNLELWNGRCYWCWSALQEEGGDVEHSFGYWLVSFLSRVM